MDKIILAVLILSVIFLAAAFMGGDPASARGFYYVIWLAFIWLLWKKRGPLETWLQSRTLPGFFLFVGLGLMMIIIEETIAGITVHLLSVKSLSELPALVTYSPRLKAGASTVHMAAKANLRLTATQVVR